MPKIVYKAKPSPEEPVKKKVAHVLREAKKGAGDHTCHFPGCGKPCPPAMWGCKSCWFKLPKPLRAKIWNTYRRGQEITKTPSREYVEVAREVRNWVLENYNEDGTKRCPQ